MKIKIITLSDFFVFLHLNKNDKVMTTLFLGGLGTGEILLIVLAILLLFGGKKLPELMRGMGRGVKEFKDAMNEPTVDAEDNKDTKDEEKKA